MLGRLDEIVRAAADDVPERDQELHEQRRRVGLGVRANDVDDAAGQPVERGLGERSGPRRRRTAVAAGGGVRHVQVAEILILTGHAGIPPWSAW